MLPLEGIMGFKPSETMLDALGNVPYTACVDNDSRMLVWLSLDLGEVIRPIVEQSMRLELEEEGYTLPEDLISSCVYTYTVSYSDFNEIGEIAPPDTLLAIMEELTGANT